ncbi:type II toxin-antitoxin system VapC family toxin [Cohnella silvisoli]|uniref:PIN domain nuclease n=1 Tax=Cohnella silvisoli TaxID=2873699 RepID=A0ABV1KQM2_9BACL|nr:PIN domain nuclease [Cohnella silvisoli]MCD9025592.1 PIN domain nuclease [Cohnella silvisoli]
MIMVDTSVWIDFFNGVESSEKEQLRKLIVSEANIAITDIILTEVLQGIRDNKNYDHVKLTLMQLNIVHAIPLDTYIHAADIYRTCRDKGFTIRKTNDCLIAAVTIESESHLLHKDKDFTAISQCVNLRLINTENV